MEGPHHYWKITAKQDCPMCKGEGIVRYNLNVSVFPTNASPEATVLWCSCTKATPMPDYKEPV